MKAAGATAKWKTFPIGGEIRPELWKKSFTARRHKRDQGFVKCVERVHATWMMDTGLFDRQIPMDAKRKAKALKCDDIALDVRRSAADHAAVMAGQRLWL